MFCTNCIILQHDAACRVIARLKKEREDARMLLAQAERIEADNAVVISDRKRGPEPAKF